MKRILKYGDKIYVCRCKKSSIASAICTIEEIILDKFNLINRWRGNKFNQYICVYGYGRTCADIWSDSKLISRMLSNMTNEITMLSNNKSHLKNRVKTEMKKKGIGFISFVDF